MIDWKIVFTVIPPLIISAIAAYISFYYACKTKQHADTVLLNNYINEAVATFERKGSATNYIRSIVLPEEKKNSYGNFAIFAIKGGCRIDCFQICLLLLLPWAYLLVNTNPF